jgi:hypothetical protein
MIRSDNGKHRKVYFAISRKRIYTSMRYLRRGCFSPLNKYLNRVYFPISSLVFPVIFKMLELHNLIDVSKLAFAELWRKAQYRLLAYVEQDVLAQGL